MGNDKSCDSKTPVGADVPASQISNGDASNLAANVPGEPEVLSRA